MIRFSLLATVAVVVSGCTAEPVAAPGLARDSSSGRQADTPVSRMLEAPAVDRIVAALMEQQYGSPRDEGAGCTPYAGRGDDVQIRYCMQAAAPEVVPAGASHDIYLRTYNRLDANGNEGYDAITPGLMGAFRVRVAPDGQWRVLEADKAMEFGTMGACGCDTAAFVRLGPDRYGWMFTSGGTWQGVTVANHEIVAPRDGRFVDLSAIPEIREDAQDVTYSIRVLEGPGDQILWPLEVSRTIGDRAPELRRVSVDPDTGLYRLPDGF